MSARQPPSVFDEVEDDGTQSSRLTELTGLALDRAKDILRAYPDDDSDHFPDELRALTSTVKTVLTTQLRVDENHLRRKVVDALPQLLAIVAGEEKKLLGLKTINGAIA